MDKQKMLSSLSFWEHEYLMKQVVREQSWDAVKSRIDEGYAITPLLLQMMVERGWASQVEDLVRNGCFWHANQQNSSLVKWFQGFFGEDEFLQLCLKKNWPSFLALMDIKAEILAQHGQWELLVKRGEWQTLIDYDELDRLPLSEKNKWIPLLLKSGKGEFLFQKGVSMTLVIARFPELKEEVFAAFVTGGHWEVRVKMREFFSYKAVCDVLLQNGQFDLLLKLGETKLLLENGQVDFLVEHKCWSALVNNGYARMVNWEEYYASVDDMQRKTVVLQAVEAGAVDFLIDKGYRFWAFKARFFRHR